MRTILRSTLDVTRFHRKLVVRGLSGVTVTPAHDAERLLVVGSGVAGSAAALIAAECYKIPTTVVFAGQKPTDCNSYWAQGGIIYRNADPDSGDSAASLAADIHNAGAGLCDQGAVQKVATEGPDRVKQLLLDKQGVFADVPFDRELDGKLSYCLGEFLAFSLATSSLLTCFFGVDELKKRRTPHRVFFILVTILDGLYPSELRKLWRIIH